MPSEGGSEAEFTVSLPDLKGVYEDLQTFRRYLLEQTESSQQTVIRLGSDWSGEAREAQEKFFGRLSRGNEKVEEGIADFSRSINEAHGHYTNAIETNRSMWRGGR